MDDIRPLMLRTVDETRAALQGLDVALVPTMGALHEGHLELVREAAELAEHVVVSIFVNPIQFGANEDLEKYPRDLDADLALLADLGVSAVFAPTPDVMYPRGADADGVRITGGPVARLYEGRTRPGHFDGVLTVVSKLLNIVQPRFAIFGEKDGQQLFLVERMVDELNIPVEIRGVETVRDEDGLALSSRNRYLSRDERIAARAIPNALQAAQSAGDRGIDAVIAAAQSALMGEELITLDYLKVVDPQTFLPVDDDHRGPARVLIAALVGSTRLIDNADLYVNPVG